MDEIEKEDTISIQKRDNDFTFRVYSYNKIFNQQRLIMEEKEDFIKFKKLTIDYKGLSYSVRKENTMSNRRGFIFTSKFGYIKLGFYKIDKEESNQDEIIIYFKDKEDETNN